MEKVKMVNNSAPMQVRNTIFGSTPTFSGSRILNKLSPYRSGRGLLVIQAAIMKNWNLFNNSAPMQVRITIVGSTPILSGSRIVNKLSPYPSRRGLMVIQAAIMKN